jgi:hypothetical protein
MIPQLLAVIFGLVLAYVNSVPVNLMIRYGVKYWENREFHNANYILKFLIALVVAFSTDGISWLALVDFTLIGLWLWASFDILINIFIHHDWDYIGDTSKIDSWLTKRFRKKAGKIKFFFCVVVIGLLNVLRDSL